MLLLSDAGSKTQTHEETGSLWFRRVRVFVLVLTRAVGSLHVVFHVALLSEADAAHLTLEGLLPRVFHHVDLQSTLLVEGLVTLAALEGSLACRTTDHSWV